MIISDKIIKNRTILASLIYEKDTAITLNLKSQLDINYDIKKIKIGRNENWSDLYLNDISISRQHATISHSRYHPLIPNS